MSREPRVYRSWEEYVRAEIIDPSQERPRIAWERLEGLELVKPDEERDVDEAVRSGILAFTGRRKRGLLRRLLGRLGVTIRPR